MQRSACAIQRRIDVPEDRMDRDMLHHLLVAVKEINYGSIEILIHNSKVVQIERREKIRAAGDGSP